MQNGTATFLNGVEERTNSLPWHIRYAVFTGDLPAFTGVYITIPGLSVRLRDVIMGTAVDCLYVSDTRLPAWLFLSRNTTTGDVSEVLGALGVEFTSEWVRSAMASFLCPFTMNWGGANSSGSMVVPSLTRAINLRLL